MISSCHRLIVSHRQWSGGWLHYGWSCCYLNCSSSLTLNCLSNNNSRWTCWSLLLLCSPCCCLRRSCYHNRTCCGLVGSCLRWITSKRLLNRRRCLNPRLWYLCWHLWLGLLMRYLCEWRRMLSIQAELKKLDQVQVTTRRIHPSPAYSSIELCFALPCYIGFSSAYLWRLNDSSCTVNRSRSLNRRMCLWYRSDNYWLGWWGWYYSYSDWNKRLLWPCLWTW